MCIYMCKADVIVTSTLWRIVSKRGEEKKGMCQPATIPHGNIITETFGNWIDGKQVLYQGHNCGCKVE